MGDLSGVKAGDKLIVGGRTGERVSVVDRTTSTLVFLSDGSKWSRRTGLRVPRPDFSWSGTERLRIASDAAVKRVQEQTERRLLENRTRVAWENKRLNERPIEQLRALAAALGVTL